VVTAADALLIQSLKKIGWVISPIAVNDNHLRATGFNLTVDIDSALTLLGGVADQLIELKLNKSGINDSIIYRIEKFQSLEKLWLENNSISDIGINSINKLKHLQYLNLSNTQITTTGLKKIISLGQLRSIYVSRTEIRPEDAKQMMALLKNVKIFTSDSLPKLPTDSLLVKKEK
jgi:Leucine-rich repeat (LRR) protein